MILRTIDTFGCCGWCVERNAGADSLDIVLRLIACQVVRAAAESTHNFSWFCGEHKDDMNEDDEDDEDNGRSKQSASSSSAGPAASAGTQQPWSSAEPAASAAEPAPPSASAGSQQQPAGPVAAVGPPQQPTQSSSGVGHTDVPNADMHALADNIDFEAVSQAWAPVRQWAGDFDKTLKTRAEKASQIVAHIFESAFGVEKRVECFGSLQYDMCLPDSDIDLCIVVNKQHFKNEAAVLQPVFERLRIFGHSLNANSIDIDSPPLFKKRKMAWRLTHA